MTDTENVVQIGDLRLARTKEEYRRKLEGCQHHRLTMDDKGDIVTCKDCKVQVSAYWALKMLSEYWADHSQSLKRQQAQAKEQQEAVLHLTAAKKAEAAWRKRDTAPCCPHCRRGILPEDGFGSRSVSRVFELGLRAREDADRIATGAVSVRKLAPRKPTEAKKALKPKSGTKPLPKWEDAPEWAQWLTQGAQAGHWTWHQNEPVEYSPGTGYQSTGQKAFAGSTAIPANGVSIKQKRPVAAQGVLL